MQPRFLLWLLLIFIILATIIGIDVVRNDGGNGSQANTTYGVVENANQGCSYWQGTKISNAAKGYINTEGLTYDTSYYAGGYPPVDRGVCTDVVWNGLKAINVTLKDEIDKDTAENFSAYWSVKDVRDPGIDFRLVPMQRVYFDRHVVSLTTNPENILAWQPGDIVVFEDEHTAVVSVLRNIFGYPYIIQHGKDPAGDEDRLINEDLTLTNHYRWSQTIVMGE